MLTKIYKVLTYILLLPAVLLSFLVLFSLLLAFANPGVLLISFILSCVIIYTVVSFNFIQKVIVNQKTVSTKLKDWIKVNAYVTMLFALMMIFNIFQVVSKPMQLRKVISEMIEQQKGNPNFYSNENVLYNVMMVIFVLFTIYSILLLVHISCGFKLLKKYNNNFIEAE